MDGCESRHLHVLTKILTSLIQHHSRVYSQANHVPQASRCNSVDTDTIA